MLQFVRTRDDQVRTMRARFSARSRRNGEAASETEGVLLVRKPDAFRLRLSLWFGPTVLDYLSLRGQVHVVLPLGEHAANGGAAAPASAFTHADLAQVFLRGGHAFPDECDPTKSDPANLVVLCHDAAGQPLRRIRIDRRTGHIREELTFEDGRPRALLTLADYRPADGAELPYRIALTYPEDDLRVDIEVRRYEVNLPLADELFRPVQP